MLMVRYLQLHLFSSPKFYLHLSPSSKAGMQPIIPRGNRVGWRTGILLEMLVSFRSSKATFPYLQSISCYTLQGGITIISWWSRAFSAPEFWGASLPRFAGFLKHICCSVVPNSTFSKACYAWSRLFLQLQSLDHVGLQWFQSLERLNNIFLHFMRELIKKVENLEGKLQEVQLLCRHQWQLRHTANTFKTFPKILL